MESAFTSRQRFYYSYILRNQREKNKKLLKDFILGSESSRLRAAPFTGGLSGALSSHVTRRSLPCGLSHHQAKNPRSDKRRASAFANLYLAAKCC